MRLKVAIAPNNPDLVGFLALIEGGATCNKAFLF